MTSTIVRSTVDTSGMTKQMMTDFIDSILRRWYGANTELSKRFKRLPKKHIIKLYTVAKLNEHDTLHEQVALIEAWANELDCEYFHQLEMKRIRRHNKMMGW